MDLFKLLGSIGLIAGGVFLAIAGSKSTKKAETPIVDNRDEDDLEASGVLITSPRRVQEPEPEYQNGGKDLNPYNRPDCLVPEEAYHRPAQRNVPRQQSRYAEEYYSEPEWIRGAKLCAEGIPNVARGLLNTISDSLHFYGMYRSGVDVETYMEEYNYARSLRGDYGWNFGRPSYGMMPAGSSNHYIY